MQVAEILVSIKMLALRELLQQQRRKKQPCDYRSVGTMIRERYGGTDSERQNCTQKLNVN